MINFMENAPITGITGAIYNPREITPEAMIALQESVAKFGMVKPLIVNISNNTIIAGHQRKKAAEAIGLSALPCILINSPTPMDEILFNIMHNSIETSSSVIKVSKFEVGKYCYCSPGDINILSLSNELCVSMEISRLISQYEEWGSAVCDEEGNILLNGDYVLTAKSMGYGCLVYCIPNSQKDEFLEYINKDYGVYNYDNLGIKTYHQFLAQPKRLSTEGRVKYFSVLYENYVIPNITKETKIIDIGAGRFKYVDMLASQGYNIMGYDPAFLKKGTNNIDIQGIVKHIKQIERSVKETGLFDVCVLEAVINSVENDEFEKTVLAVCNSLLNKDGVLITCTRNIKEVESNLRKKKLSGNITRSLYSLDSKNYCIGVMNGIAFKQKFHTAESYVNLLKRYFNDVTLISEKTAYIYCAAKEPKELPIDEVEKELNEEFNIEYPNGYRHNRQTGLVSAIITELCSVRRLGGRNSEEKT